MHGSPAGRIFFGHQSVGENILGGVRAVCSDFPIFSLSDQSLSRAPWGLYHKSLGVNREPASKLEAFRQIVERTGEYFDVAMMKLCYIDVDRDTDPQSLFSRYCLMVNEVENAYPHICLIHITVPIRTLRLGLRSNIRLLAGRRIGACEAALRRDEYNDLLRGEFASSGKLFDLARIESTRRDGKVNEVRYPGGRVSSLLPELTTDGGHLNETGASLVATHLIELLNRHMPSNPRGSSN